MRKRRAGYPANERACAAPGLECGERRPEIDGVPQGHRFFARSELALCDRHEKSRHVRERGERSAPHTGHV